MRKAVVQMYLQEIKLTGHALNLVNIHVLVSIMQTKMYFSSNQQIKSLLGVIHYLKKSIVE